MKFLSVILFLFLNLESKINILDTKELNIEGVYELSALAYKDDKLYALDNLANLHHLSIDLKDDKINSIKLLKSVKLKDKSGFELKKKKSDSEGMVFKKNKLYISFERKPRVDVFTIDGDKVKKYKIPKKLKNIDNYQGKNKALESIAYSKKYGVLVAPELALNDENKKYHILYAKNDIYKFKASASLTAIEFINENEILSLERDFSFFTFKRKVILKKIYLNECKNTICKSELLANLDSVGKYNLDNFEGLTRISKNRFLMVSDNNRSFLQKTILVLFELN